MPNGRFILFAQSCFKSRFLFLLTTILLMLLIGPLAKQFATLKLTMDIGLTAILISAVYAVSRKRGDLIIACILALLMLAAIWSQYVKSMPTLSLIGNLGGILFVAFTVIHLLKYIFHENEVSRDLIYAAIVVYLLFALLWTFVYIVVESLQPGSFSMPAVDVAENRYRFLYFSFVTLTTLGYGDITPAAEFASSLAVVEAVIGQIYLVVQVAWLVGMHVSQTMERRSR